MTEKSLIELIDERDSLQATIEDAVFTGDRSYAELRSMICELLAVREQIKQKRVD